MKHYQCTTFTPTHLSNASTESSHTHLPSESIICPSRGRDKKQNGPPKNTPKYPVIVSTHSNTLKNSNILVVAYAHVTSRLILARKIQKG